MRRFRIVAFEVFKIVRKSNPNYLKELSTKKIHTKERMKILLKH